MKSMVFSVFLLLQTAAPAARMVNGRLSVEEGAQVPSSFALPLIPTGGATTPPLPAGVNPILTIRPQIDGSFRVYEPPPGEYRVGAPGRLPSGYALQSIAYGGVDLLRSPLKISSDNSAELLINLAVSGPSPAVSVSGRVMGIASGDVHRISLREPNSNGGEFSAALETTVGADGSFTFPKVLPGNYIVYQRLLVVTPVTVGNTNVTGLVVARPKAILVSAHVIAEAAEGPTTLPNLVFESKGPAGTSQTRGTGTFILSLENGENSISLRNIPEAWHLKSMTYGDVDLQKQPLKLDGPAVWDIIVRLAPDK
jgi:hypothetical protein